MALDVQNLVIRSMDNILRRQCERLPYQVPEELLKEVLPDAELLFSSQPNARFTSKERKKIRETLQAGYLAFMVKHMSGSNAEVTVAVEELEDFDCTLKSVNGDETVYRPVQLKELPSKESNPSDLSLQELLDDLKKYVSSPELIVSIWINRNVRIDLSQVVITGLTFQQLWLVGDRPDGAVTMHGGIIADWNVGRIREGVIIHGKHRIRTISFKAGGREKGALVRT